MNTLKLESLIVGSSEETILNARNELRQLFLGETRSSAKERMYVFDKIISILRKINNLKNYFECLEEATIFAFETLIRENNDFKTIVFRVIADFYLNKDGNCTEEDVQNAICQLLSDCVIYIQYN